MISTEQILSTYQIIRPHIRRTPVIVAASGGAAALAALTSHRCQAAPDERIAVLICGGNTTAVKFDS